MQDNLQIIVHGFRHAGIFDALGILDEDKLLIYSSEGESDIEGDDFDESDEDVIQAMSSARSNLTVSTVYMDSDADSSVDPIILSSSEDNM